MKSMNTVVRESLARHSNRDPSEIHASQRLDEDLDLTPLEVVLIALDVEDEEGLALPMELLAQVCTVGDLLGFVMHARATAHRSERRGHRSRRDERRELTRREG